MARVADLPWARLCWPLLICLSELLPTSKDAEFTGTPWIKFSKDSPQWLSVLDSVGSCYLDDACDKAVTLSSSRQPQAVCGGHRQARAALPAASWPVNKGVRKAGFSRSSVAPRIGPHTLSARPALAGRTRCAVWSLGSASPAAEAPAALGTTCYMGTVHTSFPSTGEPLFQEVNHPPAFPFAILFFPTRCQERRLPNWLGGN